MAIDERPGVYSSYEVSSALAMASAGGVVGLAAEAGEHIGESRLVTSYAQACTDYGSGSVLAELVRILLLNGSAEIHAAAVPALSGAAEYAEAFDLLKADSRVKLLVCGSRDAAVHAALRQSILNADENSRYRVGFAEAEGSASELISRAAALNCERVVLVAPGAASAAGTAVPGTCAAAVAGAVSATADPALPLNGAELFGLDGLSKSFGDEDVNALIRGGVTVVEKAGDVVSVIRGVTTRGTTGGEPDATWRELTTTLIVDDVIPTLRRSLRAKFSRTKNTVQTRGAIRSQVVIELENKLKREIIDSYGNVTVTADTEDPTVCAVSFDFTVAHGLNRINLRAHITV